MAIYFNNGIWDFIICRAIVTESEATPEMSEIMANKPSEIFKIRELNNQLMDRRKKTDRDINNLEVFAKRELDISKYIKEDEESLKVNLSKCANGIETRKRY